MRAGIGPERTGFRSERANFKPERSDSRPKRADFRPERIDFRLERANFRPERANFMHERAWEGRTDGQNDGRPDVGCACTERARELTPACLSIYAIDLLIFQPKWIPPSQN